MTLISTAESFAREHGLTIAGIHELTTNAIAVTFSDNGLLLPEVKLYGWRDPDDTLRTWLDTVMPPLKEQTAAKERLSTALSALDRLTRAMEEIGGFLRMPHQYALAEAQEVLEQEGVRPRAEGKEWVDRG